MINEQPKTKQDISIDGEVKNFPVAETFHSIQGEGPYNGRPAFFIRMSGCNNRCFFCDTDYTTIEDRLSADSLVTMAYESGAKLVVITGGEPFLYNLASLITKLHNNGFLIQMETAGTITSVGFPFHLVTLICSPKTNRLNDMIVANVDTFRYTIKAGETSDEDGLPTSSTQIEGKPCDLYRPPFSVDIEVSPMFDPDHDQYRANMAACVTIAKRFNYRLNLQTHKILGVR